MVVVVVVEKLMMVHSKIAEKKADLRHAHEGLLSLVDIALGHCDGI